MDYAKKIGGRGKKTEPGENPLHDFRARKNPEEEMGILISPGRSDRWEK
jgi:hypothetical protein